MITAARVIAWDSGHRVLGHEGKCAHPHGHRYTARIAVTPLRDLDNLGRVVDFGVIKSVYQTWVDEHWDHKFICNAADHALVKALTDVDPDGVAIIPCNPTAENLARILAELPCAVAALASAGVRVRNVEVWETPNCAAGYHTGDDHAH